MGKKEKAQGFNTTFSLSHSPFALLQEQKKFKCMSIIYDEIYLEVES